MQTQRPTREFSALQNVVAEMEAQGKITRIAGVKSRLVRALNDDFDERAMGFSNFVDFVTAAQAAGSVQIEIDTDGWQRVVSPSTDAATAKPAIRVRPDLWRGFVHWREGLLRVWDREARKVFFLSEIPSEPESAKAASLRAALQTGDERLVRIEPISMEDQKLWIEGFVKKLGDHPLVEPLRSSLTATRTFQVFSAVLGADDQLREAWNRERLRHVSAEIERWASEHSIELKPVVAQPSEPRATTVEQKADGRESEATRVRAALHQAIDRAADEDLWRVRVPIGHIADLLR